jgi:hypothetical protein
MSKLAANERLKLRATFYNNLGTGLILGGLLIPYLNIVQRAGSIVERLTSGAPLTFAETANAIATLLAIILALTGGKRMRRLADETIARLQSD